MNRSRTKKWRMSVVCSLAAAALLMLPGATGLSAQAPTSATAVAAPAGTDEEFARLVREWTTRPEFLSPLVDHLPTARGVPSPKDVLGYHIGQPKTLTYYADMLKYYRALAAASPRVRVTTIGTSDEGRECVVVFVGSEESIANLDRYRGYLGQLADPRPLTDAQAMDIVGRAKPLYHLVGGLHSGETGPPEMLMELAYRLAVEDSPLITRIRDNVIVSITPSAEPDGRDRYVDWYYAYKTGETGEGVSYGGPPYWGKYILHDNNRDFNFSQPTTRAILDWYLQWHPPIMHELHESVPFLYTFSGQAPQNPTLDPILYGELPWFANFEMAQMIKYGMPGVWTHAFVDMWYPGYMGFMASNHNGMLRMYETYGNGGANTMKRRIGGAARAAWAPAAARPRASGTGRCRRTPRSSGRSATTPTTCRQASSRRSNSRRLSRGSSWRTSTARAGTPSRRAGRRRRSATSFRPEGATGPAWRGSSTSCACRASRSAARLQRSR